jgi:membrane fusion protein (multidrug efflux system)
MWTRTSSLLIVAVLYAGCGKRDDKSALPPASGSGSSPLPTLPRLVAEAAPAAAATPDRKTTGTLLPHAEVAVVARAIGVIVALDVDVGSRVKKGQVVFRVDDSGPRLRLAQAQTQFAAAQAALHGIQVEHQRTKLLFDQQAASQQQWDQITSQVEAAKVGVAQAQNGLAMANKAVADATARAPIDGVVVSRPVSLGDYVTDGPATQVLVLQDQATLDVKFHLSERALTTIRLGDAITVAVPALGLSRKAKISIVAPSVDPKTRTIELTAVLDNRDGALRPGLMADVEIDGALAEATSPRKGTGTGSGPGSGPGTGH